MITTFVAFAVYFGWLYLKQSHVEGYLSSRALVRQAQEISNFISIDDDGSIDLNLPSQLLEAYNSPGSRYRYAVRDEAGRIVATSGRRVGALPEFMPSQHHHTYEYKSEAAGKRLIGAAFRTAIGQRTFTSGTK